MAGEGVKENRHEAMRRVAVVLTVMAIIFWIAFGFFIKDVSPNNANLQGDVVTLLIFLALTVGVIWVLYGMSICIAKGSAGRKPE